MTEILRMVRRHHGATGAPQGANRLAVALAAPLCILFFLEGLVFVPRVGLQNDEVLFLAAIFPPLGIHRTVHVFHKLIPTMLMSYLGTLKAWLYLPVFHFWPPSPWSVRVPVLVLGAATIWLFFALVRHVCGTKTALAATVLLATDASYVLTSGLDWGPVVLQHFLLLTGLLLLWLFYESERPVLLACGFFALGLAMWDKALFSWTLAGLAVAALVVFPRELFRRFTWRNVGLAAAGFAIGAAPLLYYNLKSHFETFRGNSHIATGEVSHKFLILRRTLDGSGLIGYVVRDDPEPRPAKPESALERASVALSHAAGGRRTSALPLALLAAVPLIPLIWKTRARKVALFSLITGAVTWLQMAVIQNAGGSVHHAVLIWPFPQLFVAAVLTGASERLRRAGAVVLVLLIAVIAATNLIALNQHLAQLVEQGTTIVWSESSSPLARYLLSLSPKHVYTMDWGIHDTLRALGAGRLPIEVGTDPIAGDLATAEGRKPALAMLAASGGVFVGHSEGNEVMTGVSAKLTRVASEAGYRKDVLRVIEDRRGRPVFEVYRWVR